MATIKVLKFSTKLNLQGAQAGLAQLESSADQISRGIGRKLDDIGGSAKGASSGFALMSGGALAAAAAITAIETSMAAAKAAFGFIAEGVVSASHLNETISKTDVVLGESSGAVKAFADDFSKRFGRAKKDVLDAGTSIGALGKNLGGLSGKDLADFSINATKMAGDLASIQEIDMKDAAAAIRIGLAGNESDKLRELGVFLDEDSLKLEAVALGVAKFGKELNQTQKFAARSSLITKGLSFATGNLQDTIADTANASAKLSGTIANLGTDLGTALAPAIKQSLGLLNELATVGVGAFEGFKPKIEDFSSSFGAGLAEATLLLRSFEDTFGIVQLKLMETIHNIGADFYDMTQNIGIDARNMVKDMMGLNLADTPRSSSRIDVGDQVDALGRNMADRESSGKMPRSAAAKVDAGPKVDPAAMDARGNLEGWVKQQLEGAMTPMQEFARDTARLKDAMKEGIIGLHDYGVLSKKLLADSPMAKFAQDLKANLMTPMEKFGAGIAKIEQAFEAGAIDEETFNRAQMAEFKNSGLAEGMGGKADVPERKFAGATELGSKEAYSAIIQGMTGRSGGDRTQTDQLTVQRQMLNALQELNRNVSKPAAQPQQVGAMA